MSEHAVIALFFALVCAILGSMGFNQPTWSRSYTTALRYHVALGIHAALYALAFVLVAIAIDKVLRINGLHERGTALLAALLFVVILRGIPAVVRRPRAMLHRVAGIPTAAMWMADRMVEAPLQRSSGLEREAASLLANRNITRCEWLPASASQAYEQLLNATTLILQLRTWKTEARFAAFFAEAHLEFDRLHQEFDRISFRFARVVNSVERLGSMYANTTSTATIDNDLRDVVKSLFADVNEDVNLLYRDICRLATRGILATRPTRAGRVAAFGALGHDHVEERRQLGVVVLLNVAILLYVGLWVFFLAMPGNAAKGLPIAQRIPVIMLVSLASFAVAIIPKLHWGFANAGLHDRTPRAFVALAGAAAVMSAVIINLVAGYLLLGGWDGAKSRLTTGAPYLHSAFLTAVTTAWLVQDHRWRGNGETAKRLFDAATLGAVWVASTVIGQFITQAMGMAPPAPALLAKVLAGAFLFGAVIGFFIPSAVRRPGVTSVPLAPTMPRRLLGIPFPPVHDVAAPARTA